MKIIGDIGNTEVKICLVDKKFKIKKKINIQTSEINLSILKIKLKKIIKNKKKIENIVFSSVVPEILSKFSKLFKFSLNKKIIEIKKLKLDELIDIKVN